MFTDEEKKLILVFLAVVLLSAVFSCLARAQTYHLITEEEIQSIEKYSQKYETEKQNWLLQVQDLNRQLETQRTIQKKSEQSFNEFVNASTKEKNELRTRIGEQNEEICKLKIDVQKQKKNLWIVIAVCIAGWLLFIFTTFLLIKSRI